MTNKITPVRSALYKGYVILYFAVNGKPVRISLGFKASKLLDTGYLGKTSGVEDIDTKNQFIKERIVEVEAGIKDYPNLDSKQYTSMFKKGVLPTVEPLLERKSVSFLEAFKRFIEESKSGKRLTSKGSIATKNTIGTYTTTIKNLTDFSEYWLTNNNKVLDWANIDNSFYTDFSAYIWDELGFFDGTQGLRIKILKAFLNWCYDEQIIKEAVNVRKWKAYKEDINRFVLHMDEVKVIKDIPYLPKDLEEVRDVFLFGMFACMRINNLLNLKESDLKIINKEYYLSYTVQKTKNPLMIKLNPIAVSIIEKYRNKYNTLLPISGYTAFTARLRKLAKHISTQIDLRKKESYGKLLGWENGFIRRRAKRGVLTYTTIPIQDAFRSHIMRYSGITNCLALGMEPYEVCAISGHKLDSAEFVKYVNLSNTITQNKAVNLWSAALG